MRIQKIIGSVISRCSTTHWAQILKTPEVFGVIEVVDENGHAQETGMRVIAELTRQFQTPPLSLSDVTGVVNALPEQEIVSLLLFVPVGNVAYIAMRGNGCAYLKRQGTCAKLLASSGSISGTLNIGDTVLLLSQTAATKLRENIVMNVFDHLNASEVAEKMTLAVNVQGDDEGSAALVIDIIGFVEEELMEKEKTVFRSRGKLPNMTAIRRYMGLRLGSRKEAVKRHLNKTNVWIASLLFILFFISVSVGIRRELFNRRDQLDMKTVEEVKRVFEEGNALLDINAVKGRERLEQAKSTLDPLAKKATNRTKDGREILDLYGQITEALTRAMHVTSVEPQLFYDAALLKSGATISGVGLYENTLGLLDTKTKTIYALTLVPKNGQILGGGDILDSSYGVGIHGDTVYAATPNGIVQTSVSDKKLASSGISKSSEWGTISSMTTFGGNIYLLDTEKSRIWKYIAIDKTASGSAEIRSGFSDLKEYLNPDTLPDLHNARSLAIDGSVWLGTSDGKILRFTQGKEDTFVISGIEPALGQSLMVYTDDTANNIYVLDADNKRVVVMDKDGMYLSAYVWKTDLKPSALVVSEKNNIILLLVDGKLYSIPLTN